MLTLQLLPIKGYQQCLELKFYNETLKKLIMGNQSSLNEGSLNSEIQYFIVEKRASNELLKRYLLFQTRDNKQQIKSTKVMNLVLCQWPCCLQILNQQATVTSPV